MGRWHAAGHAAAGWRALSGSTRDPSISRGAVLSVWDLRQPGDRVVTEGLVDRDEAGVVLVVQRAEVDADVGVAVVEGCDVA